MEIACSLFLKRNSPRTSTCRCSTDSHRRKISARTKKNWFECIRTNKQPNAGIDLAVRAQTVISLAEMSNRLNMMCLFDETTRKITTPQDGAWKSRRHHVRHVGKKS